MSLRKFAMIFAFVSALLFLSACGEPFQQPKNEKPVAQSLEGTWSGGGEGIIMEAHIAKNKIRMTLIMRDTSGLYWAGTFPASAMGDLEITSVADQKLLQKSIFGSQDDRKQFSYNSSDHELFFDFTIMGTTQTVTLTKADS